MDNLHPFGADEPAAEEEDEAIEAPPQIGTDERRMHVRAYNYWASLLQGVAYPSIERLDPTALDDFGPHSVLLDFSGGAKDPSIAWLGDALREECGVDAGIGSVSEVPARSLLSRLTDHYMQIIANQAPVGFEAEFVNIRGCNTMYRGILMPFSAGGDTIDFIYGVINWKEVVDRETEEEIRGQFASLSADLPAKRRAATPVWADGPSSRAEDGDADADPVAIPEETCAPETLADWLEQARASAGAAQDADQRSRAALYRALGDAYDFARAAEADREGYREILEEAGIKAQQRAPMTPIVKLVFGAGYDRKRLTEYAAALGFARREDIAPGGFADYLAGRAGGLKAIVAAERARRRPVDEKTPIEQARETLRETPVQQYVGDGAIGADEEFGLVMVRRLPDGRIGIVGAVPHDRALLERAVRKLAR
ncbi:MAG: hypothetical protein ABR601_08865 [Parasphingopyxis sp.]|nr:hypothetical protein [Sphingomonadales bacterium]